MEELVMSQWLGYSSCRNITEKQKQLNDEKVTGNIVKSKVSFACELRAGLLLSFLISGNFAGAQEDLGEKQNITQFPFLKAEVPVLEPSSFQ